MVCWNVCAWCKDGSNWEEMRAVHDVRADLIDFTGLM